MRPPRKRWPRTRLLRVGRGLLLITVGLLILGGELAVRQAELPASLFAPPPTSLLITDRNGRPLREVPVRCPDGTLVYARPPLTPDAVPPLLRAATLAAEDGRFLEHHGVDWRATLRAAASRFGLDNGRRSGGSTITQQLLKLARQADGRSGLRGWRDKLAETFGAWRLERTWTKDEILAAYLARLPYGHQNVGSVAAAGYYFGKGPAELSPAEAAFLAALPQAPSRLDPHRHPERVRRRQAWVLARMRAAGNLSGEECERALAEVPRMRERTRVFRAGHFVDLLQVDGAVPRAVNTPPASSISGAARKQTARGTAPSTWRTTLDLALNEFTENELRRQLDALAGRNAHDGAAVVLDNRTGDVLALVGSRDYRSPRAGQVNGATAPRSPGSALKPFTYWLAFEAGSTPATVVADLPAEFPTTTGVYRPENYGRRLLGPVRLRTALACSLNIPAVRVLSEKVPGGPAALRTRLRDELGLTTLRQPAEHYGLGLTLGSGEVRLLELTNAYAALARGGIFRPFRLSAEAPPVPPGKPVGDPRAAFLIADILADNAARAPAFGLETPLRFAFPVAVKTGTSTDFRDNWALGFTPEFTVGVWVGNFDGRPMAGVSGVSGAGPLLHALFERLHDEHGTGWYATPAGIVEGRVHPVSGHRLPVGSPGGVPEKFLVEHPPAPEEPAQDYDTAGRVRLPAAYAAWLAGGQGGALAGLAVADGENASFAILSPTPNGLYLLDPDLPDAGRRLALRARGTGPVHWESPTLATHAEQTGESWVELTEGRHILRAREESTGRSRETLITVRGL